DRFQRRHGQAAEAGGQAQRGQELRPGGGERGIGGDQRAFGLEDVGPATQQVGWQTGGNRRPRQAGEWPAARDVARRRAGEQRQRVLQAIDGQAGWWHLLGGRLVFGLGLPQF